MKISRVNLLLVVFVILICFGTILGCFGYNFYAIGVFIAGKFHTSFVC